MTTDCVGFVMELLFLYRGLLGLLLLSSVSNYLDIYSADL